MLINELKAMYLNVGDVFTMSADLGKFTKGEQVTAKNIEPSGEDVVVTLVNDEGTTDTFYFDKDEEI
jgi:hypothetical protein